MMRGSMKLMSIAWVSLFFAHSTDAGAHGITASMIEDAQNTWVEGLIAIGAAVHGEGDPAEVALAVLEQHYDYAGGGVLFKPTLATGAQTFRLTQAGALAYFVGNDPDFADDSGFALKPYVSGEVEMAGVIVHGDTALAMSKITLTAYDGATVTVDKTFAYRLDDEGQLRIILHHSSLPFSAE